MKLRIAILSEQELELVHNQSLYVLQNIGVKFNSKKALGYFKNIGVEVDYKTLSAKIPSDLVEKSIRLAPRQVTLCGRIRKTDIVLDGSRTYVTTDGQGAMILDLRSGTKRFSTQKDLENCAVVADGLEEADLFWPMAVANDVKAKIQNLVELKICLANTSKHIQHTVLSEPEAPYIIDIIEAALENQGSIKDRPIVSMIYCPLSPLQHDYKVIDGCIEVAKQGVPIFIYPMPLAGGTAPITLAGTILINNIEFLSGLTLFQLVKPKLPIIYGIGASILDMWKGQYSAGAPEASLMNIALAQMAERYALPSNGSGLCTDAIFPGIQAGYEKMMSGLTAFLAGVDLVSGIGLLEGSSTVSLEQMWIDNDICGMIRRIVDQGMEVSEQSLLLETLEEIKLGHGVDFFTKKSTLDLFRSEQYFPKFGSRSSGRFHNLEKMEIAAVRKSIGDILKYHKVVPLGEEALNRIEKTISIARLDKNLII